MHWCWAGSAGGAGRICCSPGRNSASTGFRLRPGRQCSPTCPSIADQVVPALQRPGRFRTGYRDGETLRERLRAAGGGQPIRTCEVVMNVPLSILDLSPISAGCDAPSALRNTVDLARHAEQWGYQRYWVAEHHFVAVAGSNARGADRPDRRRHRTHQGRRRGRSTRLHHRGGGGRELRHARGLPSRPHRPRPRPLRAAPPRGRSATAGPNLQTRPRAVMWRDVDGVVVPPPFDTARAAGQPANACAGHGADPTRSRAAGFRRAGRRHPGPARRKPHGGRVSRCTPCPARAPA